MNERKAHGTSQGGGVPSRRPRKISAAYEARLIEKFSKPVHHTVGHLFHGFRERPQERIKGKRYKVKQNPFLFSTLPEYMRDTAHRVLETLIAKCREEGREISQQKYASMVGNATHLTRDAVFSHAKRLKCNVYRRHLHAYQRIMEERAMATARRRKEMQDAGML